MNRNLWLVTLGILLCLGGTAYPGLRGSDSESEASIAVGSMRSINTAEAAYARQYRDKGFACDLRDLGPESAGFLDDSLTSAKPKDGYQFQVRCATRSHPQKTYISSAAPVAGKGRAFCSDQTAVIKYSDDGKPETCQTSGKPIE